MEQLLSYLPLVFSVFILLFLLVFFLKLTNFEKNQNLISNTNTANQKVINDMLDQRLLSMQDILNNSVLQNEQKLENIRKTLEERIQSLQSENARQLDEMRHTVDEKLQKTLEERITQSFKIVSESLEAVTRGLGEMTVLANDVGDLRNVLKNVKTRGILGENQLAAILSEILAPNQYLTDVATIRGSTNRVEFAIKLPNDNKEPVLLPIDSKFPLADYERLLEAYDKGDLEEIDAHGKKIETSLKKFAKDIKDKYIQVPDTTEFGILFLPIEGLYAEVVRRGMVETLQREYQITLAGPTTMAALLNSLQMGFRTLAIQERSNEVWQILAGVKDEFNNFATVLSKHQERLSQANEELDKLVGVRTRQIVNKLNKIDRIETAPAPVIEDEE